MKGKDRIFTWLAMLDLRAVFLNDDWDDFQAYRIQQNGHTLYPYRERVQEIWDLAA